MKLPQSFSAICLAVLVFGCAGTTDRAPLPDYVAIVAAPDRSEADRQNDQRRNPVQLFAFTEARPGMKVLDMGAGGGYSTEMLARIVAPGGIVYSQNPAGMFPGAIKAYEARAKSPAMKNAIRVERPFEDPLPPGVDRALMNKRLFDALKPGGLLVVADHSARPGDGVNVAKSLHRVEESVVRRELEAAGFQFVAEGRFLRNPDDPRTEPVAKPKAPNDEFVLKYRKP